MDLDLNCDLGEGCPFDEELIPLVTSVNIACGFHAGDPETAEVLLRRGARRFAGAGLAVTIARPPAGCDFNDVLRRGSRGA